MTSVFAPFLNQMSVYHNYVEQIFRDEEFWAACVGKAKHFSQYVCYLRYLEIGTLDLLFQVIHYQIPASPTKTIPIIVK